ncbi:type II toxin-antitoxin system HicA family toxin [Candidatus Nomurabacteria bacterium]|nr:type II toxin-antitoxin system HicA family toxin [Candidatus Nomurabacteria bacterium]
MPKPISVKKLIQNLNILGFTGSYSGGRHMFMIKGNLKLRIPNPHKGDISKHLLSEILRQAGISTSEWVRKRF